MVNPNIQNKMNYDEVVIGGVPRGMSSLSGHSMPRGFADTIDNMIFDPGGGIITRLGWNTVSQGFEGAGSFPDAQSGGWDSTVYGRHLGKVGYVNNGSGKVSLFAGAGRCDTATGIQFETGTSSAIALPGGQAAFLGTLYFASTFLVYTAAKLYSLNMANGALTEEVDFATDIGSEYGPIVRIIERYGQLWAASKKDRIFWSDVGEYTAGNGAAVTDQPLPNKRSVWQEVYQSKLVSIEAVEIKINTWFVDVTNPAANARVVDGWLIKANRAFCFLELGTGDISSSDPIDAIISYAPYRSQQRTVDTVADFFLGLDAAATAGDNFVALTKDGDGGWQTVRVGNIINVADVSNNEDRQIVNIINEDTYITCFFDSTETLTNSYADTATATVDNVVKVTVTSAWTINANLAAAPVWYPLSSDFYDSCLDPENDDDCGGHIRLHSDAPGTEFRIDYTPYENDWATDESGWQDIAQAKGDNIAMAEGPNYREDEGAGLLYIFKNNGDIHVLTGKAGPGGTFGNLDIKFICSGIRARPNSIQVTRDGVYFGAIEGIRYRVYFFQHGESLLTKEIVAHLTADYWFDTDVPFDDSTFAIYEQSLVFNGNLYGITFPNSTSGLPVTNGFTYFGQAYRDEERGGIHGRWCRSRQNNELEYEEDSGNTVPAGGAPLTAGFYEHDGTLCKVYTLKTGHDFAGDTRYYEIATYGWRVGAEECKDSYVMTYDAGGGSYTTVSETEYFKPKIKYPMMQLSQVPLDVHEIYFDADVVSGSTGDGMDMVINIYRDLEATVVPGYPKTVENLTDDATAPLLLKRKDARFRAKYASLEFEFDNIKYSSKPAYLYWRVIALKAARLADRLLIEEKI